MKYSIKKFLLLYKTSYFFNIFIIILSDNELINIRENLFNSKIKYYIISIVILYIYNMYFKLFYFKIIMYFNKKNLNKSIEYNIFFSSKNLCI